MDQLPPEMYQAYQHYLGKPRLTRELLIAKVRPYLGIISEATARTPELDIGMASELAGALIRLLRECTDEQLPHVQAAVHYFVESDDSEPDLESPDGFSDDAEFFNAVCHQIGRPDLVIEVR